MESSTNLPKPGNFTYDNRFIKIAFGQEKNAYLIHDALVYDNYFAMNISNSGSTCYFGDDGQCTYERTVSLHHISRVTGYTLIHFLYTGQLRVQDEQDNSDSATDQHEKHFKQIIEILFAAEMCNLFKLLSLGKLEIERLGNSMDFIKLLELVDPVLNSEWVSQRPKRTFESRKWLTQFLKKKLRVFLESDENRFSDLPVFTFIQDVALMQEMGTEIVRFYYNRILNARSEISEATERDSIIERKLETMEEMIQILDGQSVVKNGGKNVCNTGKESIPPIFGESDPEDNDKKQSRVQIADENFETNMPKSPTSQVSDESYIHC